MARSERGPWHCTRSFRHPDLIVMLLVRAFVSAAVDMGAPKGSAPGDPAAENRSTPAKSNDRA
jgi:hypothetical protein